MQEIIKHNDSSRILQDFIDYELHFIDIYSAIPFVICQTYITYIVSTVKYLNKKCQEDNPNNKLSFIEPVNKENLMKYSSNKPNGSNYTFIEIINALANFYKHEDDWPNDTWENILLNKNLEQAQNTIRILIDIGIKQDYKGRFMEGAERIGNYGYKNYAIYKKHLTMWTKGIFKAIKKDLEGLKLI